MTVSRGVWLPFSTREMPVAAGCGLSNQVRVTTITRYSFHQAAFPRSIETRMANQEIQTHSIANGLTLIIEPMADVQSAVFSLLVPAGSNFDPPEKAGAAAVLCDWILRGAGSRDSRQLSNELDNLGLQRNEGVGNSHISFTGATLAESLPKALRHCAHAAFAGRPV